MRIPWILRALWNSDVELDLLDDTTGKIDHGKATGFFAFMIFVVLMIARVIPASVGLVIVLIAAIFGQRAFIAFLRSRTVTEHQETIATRGEPPVFRDFDNPDDSQ